MKKNNLLLTFLISYFCYFNILATEYYIDPVNGNDNNNGTSSSIAFKSLYKIDALQLQPGDIVYFMEGTYERSGQTLLTISESGTAENWITLKNYPNHTPILEFDSWTGIDLISGSSYIKIDGLHIKGARSKVNPEDALIQSASCGADQEGGAQGFYNGTGILAVGPNLTWSNSATNSVPHHISITNCEIYDCTSSGIAFQQADYISIKNNKVYNNCWYTVYGTSGINLYQFVNTDSTTGFHNEITNNLMYGNQLIVPQIPYCAFYDGNGFIIDDFNHTQTNNYKNIENAYDAYDAKTLVANNVSVENGGSGLHFFLSSNCYIFNNTVANNAFQNDGSNGNGELRIGKCNDFVIKNNIFKSDFKVHNNGGNTNIDYSYNYQYGPGIQSTLANCDNCINATEVEFINTDINDSKPYITDFTGIFNDTGIILEELNTDYLGNSRPYGTSYDIGAYELYECELLTWYADIDNDGYGNPDDVITDCEQPEGYVDNSTDLCINDSAKYEPGECGCNIEEGTCEEECENPINWYADNDNDGYGNPNDIITDCEQPEGYVDNNADLCVNDSAKYEPGECGCGTEEGTCGNPEDLCESSEYNDSTAYSEAGTTVLYNGSVYQNKWYSKGQLPSSGGPWELIMLCDAEGTDCSAIESWSSTSIYSAAGNQVVYEQNIYENKWYIAGGTPGVNAAWELIGFCNTTTSNDNLSFEVNIYDLNGSLISTTSSTSTNTSEIDSNELDSGIYIVNFTNQSSGEVTIDKISN